MRPVVGCKRTCAAVAAAATHIYIYLMGHGVANGPKLGEGIRGLAAMGVPGVHMG